MADEWLSEFTPFGALKTAEQTVQFGLDPSRGLTRERYQWYSNGTRFDDTHFTDGAGEIEMETSATGTDTARLHSGLSGQYVSQSLAKPGIKLYIDPSNVEIDDDGYVSLTHGRASVGPFIESGGSIQTGFGITLTESGTEAFWKSNGAHQGNSPVPQSEWKTDQLNSDGQSGIQYSPAKGYILNFPYTWYNNGKLGIALLDPVDDELVPVHSFNPPIDGDGRASLITPNLPVQVMMSNEGTASSLVGAVGGMQYTLYGAASALEVRDTYKGEEGVSIGTAATADPWDPVVEPGEPIYAVTRDPSYDTVELRLGNINITPDSDIYVYVWDIYDNSALTGATFEEPWSNYDTEARSLVDISATAFDNTNAVFRKAFPVLGGSGSNISLTDAEVDERIPLNATRVVTVVGQSSTNVTLDFLGKQFEGF